MDKFIEVGDKVQVIVVAPMFEGSDAYVGNVLGVSAHGFAMEHNGAAIIFTWAMPLVISFVS